MIIYSCPDLIFSTRISAAAEKAQVKSQPAQSQQEMAEKLSAASGNNEKITVLIDLETDSALQIIETAKNHPSSPKVIAFGAHIDKNRLKEAEDCGADKAMPRSAFVAKLDKIVGKN